MNTRLLLMLFAFSLFTQCDKDEMSEIEKRQKEDDQKINDYLAENDISAQKHRSGLYYLEIEENPDNKKVSEGDIIYAKYTVSTLDGDDLDVDTDTIVVFEHGSGSLVPEGLDIGCGLMHKGEKLRFFIPSVLVFNRYSNPDFKLESGSILVCDLEVVDIQGKDERLEEEKELIANYIETNKIESLKEFANGLYFKKLTAQDQGSRPDDGDIVKVHFERRYLDGTIHFSTFHNNPVSVQLGKNAVEGLEEGIKLLKPGERGLLIFPSELGFGAGIQVIPHELKNELTEDGYLSNTPEPFSPLVYEIELLD
ncbi:FKBP-type peptidyl-prolyl cis-trans isomerase [Marinilabilia sp.]|uniref:FKBP-type peptidyl-prolyl cis-trans isomerase n=1 Tax=Marinilabilia sp. TaxID=2021252 RepID=UPI0025C0368A|nr:FKBP-type peptidyl-prolyl cis-trans isomerase [Marinilabilia sp.]